MHYLQIHDSRKITEIEHFCIARLKSLLRPSDSYTYIQIPLFENIVETVNYSDRIRFDWLSEHPDGVYIDTDCYINITAVPPKDSNLPCFPRHPEGHIDIFWIIVNGNTQFFKDNFCKERREIYLTTFVEEKFRSSFYGWPVDLIKNLPIINTIPAEAYNHTYQTMAAEIRRRGL